MLALLALAAALALVDAPARAVAAECPNEAIRQEQGSTFLPECRAYELVTGAPGDGNDEPFAVPTQRQSPQEFELDAGLLPGTLAAVNGERLAWMSNTVLSTSDTPGLDFLATRGSSGWHSEDVVPPQSEYRGILCPERNVVAGWSADLSRGVFADGGGQGNGPRAFSYQGYECGHDEPRLATGELDEYQNLFLRDNSLDTYRLINITPPGVEPPSPETEAQRDSQFYEPAFLAGSADLSRIVFEAELPLTASAGSGDELYAYDEGQVQLVSVLPDGQGVEEGRLAGSTRNTSLEEPNPRNPNGHYHEFNFTARNIAQARNAISTDGRRIFWTHGGNLFLRENPEAPPVEECARPTAACTVQIDESHDGGAGGGGEFQIASATGSAVYFTDDAEADLTADTVPGSGDNLYRYDVASASLTDLTPSSQAHVLGVSGAAEDGSHVYFVADGALTGGMENSAGAIADEGRPNLYSYTDGAARFIGSLNAEADPCDWNSDNGCGFCDEGACEGNEGNAPVAPREAGLRARVSPNGEYLAFPSIEPLTGFDNHDALTGEADPEIFIFDSADGDLRCASCGSLGEAPTGPSLIRYPTKTGSGTEGRNSFVGRNLTDDGSLFFETPNALVGRDVNDAVDVYRYRDGQLGLISSGHDAANSYFIDASADGRDVFFATAQPLVGADADQTYDYYDARVDGGFAEPASPPPCTGESCKGSTGPPPSASPVGSGGPQEVATPAPRRCRPGRVKRGTRCVARKSRRRHRGRKSRHQHHLQKDATANKRGHHSDKGAKR